MTYLTSGPLMTIPERREALIERMAADLAGPVVPDQDDARAILLGKGYSVIGVHCVLAEVLERVRYEAQHEIVAKEMSAS
jgi:hypothetical protein